jgi:hypothetical protein
MESEEAQCITVAIARNLDLNFTDALTLIMQLPSALFLEFGGKNSVEPAARW